MSSHASGLAAIRLSTSFGSVGRCAVLALAVALAACDGDDEPVPVAAALVQNCAALKGVTIAASQIGAGSAQPGLATSGATVGDAVLVDASATLPQYCKVTGAVGAATAGSPAINFEVNLPANWNGKALQYGGGGLNGSLVSGLAPLPSAAPVDALPLARGYVTLGSDSGHQAAPGGPDATFALNDEALTNFAYAQMKKTRDVALALAGRAYQRDTAASPVYFFGSSEGGREALTVAQRFPADYAGVVARVPVIQFTGLQLNGNRISKAVRQPGAWMNAAEVARVHAATLAKCDAADNLADGIIGRPLDCTLTAAEQAALGLSAAQAGVLTALHAPISLGFPLTGGNTGYFPSQWGGELSTGSAIPVGGIDVWWLGTAAPTAAGPSGVGSSIGDAFVRYFVARNAGADPATFDPAAYQARIQQLSAMLDSDNPDLSAFFAKGGKAIVKEHGADYAHSPRATVDYVSRVVARDAVAAANGLRLYVNPMVDHSGTGVQPDSVDLLTQLENWVERGQAPADALTVSRHVNNTVTQSRLMCRYPAYPRYNGSGDVNSAGSFGCSTAP